MEEFHKKQPFTDAVFLSQLIQKIFKPGHL